MYQIDSYKDSLKFNHDDFSQKLMQCKYRLSIINIDFLCRLIDLKTYETVFLKLENNKPTRLMAKYIKKGKNNRFYNICQ